MDRREIVNALCDHFGVKPQYLGAPTFAYQVAAANETYTIDRTGKIVTSAGKEVTLESIRNGIFKDNQPCEATVSLTGHTPKTLRNLINLLYSKQNLVVQSLNTGSEIVKEDFVRLLNYARLESMDDFKWVLAHSGDTSYQRIIFDFDADMVKFNLLGGNPSSDMIQAYMQFITLLNETAKKLKYTSPKLTVTENPKFTFRLFLIRLGMVGNEYKLARKLLLEKLEGNSAFKRR